MHPKIYPDQCDCCGVCVEICPSEVYQMRELGVDVAFPEECIECGACVKECPAECIVLVEG